MVSIENVALDSGSNSATTTVRNTGILGVSVSRVYVETQSWDQANLSIPPERSQDFSVNNITPALVKGKSYTIRVVTSKGTSLQGQFSAS